MFKYFQTIEYKLIKTKNVILCALNVTTREVLSEMANLLTQLSCFLAACFSSIISFIKPLNLREIISYYNTEMYLLFIRKR